MSRAGTARRTGSAPGAQPDRFGEARVPARTEQPTSGPCLAPGRSAGRNGACASVCCRVPGAPRTLSRRRRGRVPRTSGSAHHPFTHRPGRSPFGGPVCRVRAEMKPSQARGAPRTAARWPGARPHPVIRLGGPCRTPVVPCGLPQGARPGRPGRQGHRPGRDQRGIRHRRPALRRGPPPSPPVREGGSILVRWCPGVPDGSGSAAAPWCRVPCTCGDRETNPDRRARRRRPSGSRTPAVSTPHSSAHSRRRNRRPSAPSGYGGPTAFRRPERTGGGRVGGR